MLAVSSAPVSSQEKHRPTPAAAVAGIVCGLHALVLLGAAALYLRELVTATATESSVAAMSLVVTTIFAVLLLVLTRGWLVGRLWPRSPTIVWCLLTLPAIWTIYQAGGLLLAVPLAVLSIAGLLAALSSPAADLPEDAVH